MSGGVVYDVNSLECLLQQTAEELRRNERAYARNIERECAMLVSECVSDMDAYLAERGVRVPPMTTPAVTAVVGKTSTASAMTVGSARQVQLLPDTSLWPQHATMPAIVATTHNNNGSRNVATTTTTTTPRHAVAATGAPAVASAAARPMAWSSVPVVHSSASPPLTLAEVPLLHTAHTFATRHTTTLAATPASNAAVTRPPHVCNDNNDNDNNDDDFGPLLASIVDTLSTTDQTTTTATTTTTVATATPQSMSTSPSLPPPSSLDAAPRPSTLHASDTPEQQQQPQQPHSLQQRQQQELCHGDVLCRPVVTSARDDGSAAVMPRTDNTSGSAPMMWPRTAAATAVTIPSSLLLHAIRLPLTRVPATHVTAATAATLTAMSTTATTSAAPSWSTSTPAPCTSTQDAATAAAARARVAALSTCARPHTTRAPSPLSTRRPQQQQQQQARSVHSTPRACVAARVQSPWPLPCDDRGCDADGDGSRSGAARARTARLRDDEVAACVWRARLAAARHACAGASDDGDHDDASRAVRTSSAASSPPAVRACNVTPDDGAERSHDARERDTAAGTATRVQHDDATMREVRQHLGHMAAALQHTIRLALPDFAASLPPPPSTAEATPHTDEAATAAVAATTHDTTTTATVVDATTTTTATGGRAATPAWRNARLFADDGTLDEAYATYLDACDAAETALARDVVAPCTSADATQPDTLAALLLRCVNVSVAHTSTPVDVAQQVAKPHATSALPCVTHDVDDDKDAYEYGAVTFALHALGYGALQADDWACNGHYVATASSCVQSHRPAAAVATAHAGNAACNANAHLARLARRVMTLPGMLDAQRTDDDAVTVLAGMPVPLEAVAAVQLELQQCSGTSPSENLQDVLSR